MAGYNASYSSTYDMYNRNYNPGLFNRLLKRVSSWGMKYDDMIIKNQVTVGLNQIPTAPGNTQLYDVFSRNAISKLMEQKSISYLQQEYPEKRRILQEYSSKDMIREVLTIVCDEAIISDEEDGFCRADDLPEKFDKSIREKYISNFNKLYQVFGFNHSQTAWNHFRRLLVDGFIAFEIVYDNRQRNIISLSPIDPSSIVPAIDPNGGEQVWIQYPEDPIYRRILLDSQIVYISYSNTNNYAEISYVEGLIRPYNQLKLMEQARLMFNIIHASMHKKFIIPTGGLSRQLAEEQISKMITDYKDEVSFDDTLGTVKINGSPHIPYSKEYWFPQGDAGTPSFELVTPGGINLNEDSTLDWFYKQFKRGSRIPLTRFDETTGGGNMFAPDAAGVSREELSFFNFVNRLRDIFKEILVKPLKIQMILDFPELKDDDEFLSHMNISFNGVNLFHEWRKIGNLAKRAEIASQLATQVQDAEGKPYFHVEWIVKKILKMTDEELGENERYKRTSQTPAEAVADAGSLGGGGGGTPSTTTTAEPAAPAGGGEAGGGGETTPTETPAETPAPEAGGETPPAAGGGEAPAPGGGGQPQFDF